MANDPDLRFGEFNFGTQRLAHVLLQYKKQILANFILANADDSPNSPNFPPAKITRYTVFHSFTIRRSSETSIASTLPLPIDVFIVSKKQEKPYLVVR